MAEKSGFFNAIKIDDDYDRKYNAEDYSDNMAAIISNGVRRSGNDDLRVKIDGGSYKTVSEGGKFNVTVNAGRAWINGHWYYNDTTYTFTDITPTGRTDGVFVQLDSNQTVRAVKLVYKQGTNDAAPFATRSGNIYEIQLAKIQIESSRGQYNITVTDTRADKSVCGWITTPVGYDDFFATFEAGFSDKFNIWFNQQKYNLDNTPAGKIQKQIDNVIKDNGIACLRFDEVKRSEETPSHLRAMLVDNDKMFINYNSDGLSKNDGLISINEQFYYGEGRQKISVKTQSPYDVYVRGNCFEFDDGGTNDPVMIKITQPGEYKIDVNISGTLDFIPSNVTNCNFMCRPCVGLRFSGEYSSQYSNDITLTIGQNAIDIKATPTNNALNITKTIVIKIDDGILPAYVSMGLYFRRYSSVGNIPNPNMLWSIPKFDVTIEPVKLTRGIPQDLINMVATTPEGYEELKANDKIDPETAYFVSDGTNVILYLGEVKISTSKDTSLGAIQELLTGTKTSIIGQQGSVE